MRAEGTNTAQLLAATTGAADMNTIEIIRQLQRRIEELEQKVETLERDKAPAEEPGEAKPKQRFQELDQKVKILERERELDQEAQEAKAKEAPRISIGGNGFSFASASNDFALQLKGVLQVDSRTFFDGSSAPANDSLILRRVRPILQGTFYRDFDFLFLPDFAPSSGPTIYDAYVNYRYSPALQFQTGKFRVPFGLEQSVQDRDILFNERALATDLVPNRDVGFELHGDLFDGRASYAAGIFNGTTDGGNSSNTDFADDRAFAGRLFFQPFKKAPVNGPARVWIRPGGHLRDHVHDQHRGFAVEHRWQPAGLLHRWSATVLRLQPGRQGRRGGQQRSLAAFSAGVLLLRAVWAAGGIRHFRSASDPDGSYLLTAPRVCATRLGKSALPGC